MQNDVDTWKNQFEIDCIYKIDMFSLTFHF